MKQHQPTLLEFEDVGTKANQAAILHIMAKYGLKLGDFKSSHRWINQGLNIPSMGGYGFAEDRVFYAWGRYERFNAPKDTHPRHYLKITVAVDHSCSVEDVERGVYDEAFTRYWTRQGSPEKKYIYE
jgi:hypothetical protein